MSVLRRRSHTLSIRVSEEEYLALRRLCAATDARSISDLIRDTVQSLVNSVKPEHSLSARMDEFAVQLKNLGRCLEELAARPRHEPNAEQELEPGGAASRSAKDSSAPLARRYQRSGTSA